MLDEQDATNVDKKGLPLTVSSNQAPELSTETEEGPNSDQDCLRH